jgi:peptidoglycan/LPS O-acetylase OafA/YrhL
MSSSPRPTYVPALDGLRAIAVVMVMLFHAGATSGLPGLAPGGFIGVSVFFTISGFLVTTLLLRQGLATGSIDTVSFWSRRIKRLWPASLVVVLSAVLLAGRFWDGMRPSDAAAGVLGYTNWHVIISGRDALLRTIVGPLGPFWSLAIEEQFYVGLTIACVLAFRSARPVRVLGVIFAIGWLGSLATQLLVSGPQYWLEFSTLTRIGEILAGCALALLLDQRPQLLAGSTRWLAIAGPSALVVIVLLAATNDYDPPWLLHGGYSLVSILSAVLVMSLLAPSRVSTVLSRRPLVVVGVASYSLYLVHWPVMLILTPDRTGLDEWPLVALKLAVASLVAAVLHLVVEQPLRRQSVGHRNVFIAWAAACAGVIGLAVIVL